ncbi:uncharacterized protein [Prorops nasuta]|uniref:uncharacterized protein n=1 Tax=Prorops nasuta TaxID=863751 RepID=UPI0034CFF23C
MSKEKVQLVELHRSARKNFPRHRVIINGYDDFLWQADLVDMRAYTHQNKGNQYILVVIDTFSKYAWAEPIKKKTGNEVTKAFSKIIKSRKPKNLQTDDGKEFYNKTFQDLMKKHTINHYSTYSIMKASIVERFNRTLKNDMWKLFTMNGSYKWINILPTIINDYNRRKHRTTGMKPVDINAKNSTHLLNTVYRYTPNWTTAVFKVKVIQKTNPVSYLLQDLSNNDIKGAFYEQELSEVKDKNVYLVEKILRKKGNKVFVKWLGFDKSHNSWIDKDNVFYSLEWWLLTNSKMSFLSKNSKHLRQTNIASMIPKLIVTGRT